MSAEKDDQVRTAVREQYGKIAPIPPALRQHIGALTGCVSGAASIETTRELLRTAGFEDVRVDVKPESRGFIRDWLPGSDADRYVASATIEARKPKDRA